MPCHILKWSLQGVERLRSVDARRQSSLVQISEYLTKVDPSLPRLWKDDEDLRMTSIIPQGKGMSKVLMKEELRKLNVFCVLNSEVMSKWVTLYKEARAVRK